MDSNDPSPQQQQQQKPEAPAQQDPPIELLAADGACSLSTGTLVVALEENSHTTDSSTEPNPPPSTPEEQQEEQEEEAHKDRGKHVCFNSIEILKPECPTPVTTKTYDNVREYVRQIESLSELQHCYGECRQTAKKRQHQNQQSSDAEADEREVETNSEELAQKRMRGDSNDSADISINETSEKEAIVAEVADPVAVHPPRPDVSVALMHVEQDNQEIAERFKLIMEMFDSFTKNLESLERPTSTTMVRDASKPIRRKRTNSWEVKDISPRVHRSRYDNYMQELTGKTETSEADIATDPPSDAQVQQHTWQLDYFSGSACLPRPQAATATEARIELNTLRPAQKDIATAISGIDLHLNDSSGGNSKDQVTIACQTVPTAEHSSTLSMSSNRTDLQHFTSLERVETLQNYSPMDCRVETYIIDNNATHNAYTTTYNAAAKTVTSGVGVNSTVPPDAAVGDTKTRDTNTNTNSKVLAPHSPLLERCPYMSAVSAGPIVEHTFHTIHIEATSSPSSSVMQRAPLCTRFWNVITDFCSAVCLCLQVNRDSLFCLGFCIAFVVSASFLTAFFYRTLSVSPEVYHQQQMLQQQQQQQQQQASQGAAGADPIASASGRDNFYYL